MTKKELPLISPYEDDNGVGLCHEKCPQYDGKRCELMGRRPSEVCYPWADNRVRSKHAKKYRVEFIEGQY